MSVAKIPGTIAYPEIMERIIDKGLILDGWSQLAAITDSDVLNYLTVSTAPNDLPAVPGESRDRSPHYPRRRIA